MPVADTLSRTTLTSRITRRIRGYSLIEFMIAITLGMVILAGVTTIFLRNSSTRSDLERGYQQNDNGLYALQAVSDDLRNAGYLADFDPKHLPTAAAMPDVCASTLTDLAQTLPYALQGIDDITTAPACLPDARTASDVIAVRRIATCSVGSAGCAAPAVGTVFLQHSRCNSFTELASQNRQDHYRFDVDTSKLGLLGRDCISLAPYHEFRTHIYYVANNDKAQDGIPTLKRAELVPGGFSVVSVAQGVENLQIEYGIDSGAISGTALTGAPGAFTANPGNYNGCTGAICTTYWRNAVSARVHLLVRGKTPTMGHADNKTYQLGLKADGTANSYTPPRNDAYKRRVFSATARINNVSGRNTP